MAHAIFSPSSADRWFKCPASAYLNYQAEYTVGLPAATGTLIHSMTEMLLKDRLRDMTLRDYWLGRKEVVEDFEIEVDEDMVACAEVYVDYIEKRQKELGARSVIEEKVYLDEISDKCHGTADCILLAEDRICVIDLKSGKWNVEAMKNKQLMIYGLGALTRYGGGNPDITMELTIVQPRVKNQIKTFEISAPNLVEWGFTDLKQATDACDEESPQYNFGDHCRFCNAKADCDEYKLNSEKKND
jgi:hypothetical protein|tara:strand:- start:75 stop:806 length:732 start_codon:yes stop_codon:yes gene_type:complete